MHLFHRDPFLNWYTLMWWSKIVAILWSEIRDQTTLLIYELWEVTHANLRINKSINKFKLRGVLGRCEPDCTLRFFLVCLSDKIVILSWNCKLTRSAGSSFFFLVVSEHHLLYSGTDVIRVYSLLDLHDCLGGFFFLAGIPMNTRIQGLPAGYCTVER